MLYLLIAGIGVALLILSLVFDDILDGLFGIDAPFLSSQAIGAGTGLFGFTAYLTDQAGWGTVPTVALAVGIGIAAAAAAGLLARSLRDAATDPAPSSANIIGLTGTVTSPIAEGEYGQVSLSVSGYTMRYAARAAQPIPVGAPVEVTAALSSSAVMVTPLR